MGVVKTLARESHCAKEAHYAKALLYVTATAGWTTAAVEFARSPAISWNVVMAAAALRIVLASKSGHARASFRSRTNTITAQTLWMLMCVYCLGLRPQSPTSLHFAQALHVKCFAKRMISLQQTPAGLTPDHERTAPGGPLVQKIHSAGSGQYVLGAYSWLDWTTVEPLGALWHRCCGCKEQWNCQCPLPLSHVAKCFLRLTRWIFAWLFPLKLADGGCKRLE